MINSKGDASFTEFLYMTKFHIINGLKVILEIY